MSVKRIYVEKKAPFAIQAKDLKAEIKEYLRINTVTGVRVLTRYDIENISDEVYESSKQTIFSEPPLDELYEGPLDITDAALLFSVEYLPGQFDQRADSAVQCIKLINENEEPAIKTATTYIIYGTITEAETKELKAYCINPVDSRETTEEIPETLAGIFETPDDVRILEGFKDMGEAALKELFISLNLAMTFKDFLHIQNYFNKEEKRNPSMTEVRVLDTYWSDHCRHTTFLTELKNVTFDEGDYKEAMEASYQKYLDTRSEVFGERKDKPVCLMDLALIAMRKLKKEGKLDDQEESDEINACSIVVPVEIDGVKEEWLVNFKNETHNHPTEIEPFGGAATCLGGAIRDPLSGRTYVYHAMRVTGAADPTVPVSETMKGKLPQRKLVTEAAKGYSSYGNQIGLATGYVKEIYHPGYAAKRMEIGAVVGAAARKNVMRKTSDPGDIILLLGGRTGRDGCGGATGSSKVHTESSIETCGAEVQKGNAPTERKIQRLFRRSDASKLIKKCNDFGAGGVSVAIGELADGLFINLDKVPRKYEGLDGTELAISESQERMAVVLDPKDVKRFLQLAAEENLEAVEVAVVTEEKRLVMKWRDKVIVDISRSFLDTNGAHQETDVSVASAVKAEDFRIEKPIEDLEAEWLRTAADLNVCSQKGLVERFDSSIGAGSVLMPYGGKYQMTETQVMVAKLPIEKGLCDTVTMMSYGFDPYLSSWSPYHGAAYAVISSVGKIVSAGGDYRNIRFTFQEYFKRMTEDAGRWGEPFQALLGAFEAQLGLGLPSIGGKDSMSGSFNEINVPPTLVSFAITTANGNDIISPELKHSGDKLYLARIRKDANDMPDFLQIKALYDAVACDIKSGAVNAAYEVERGGIAEAIMKMSFGNQKGAALNENLTGQELFAPGFGCLVLEACGELSSKNTLPEDVICIGEVLDEAEIRYPKGGISTDALKDAWEAPLEKVFPTKSTDETRLVISEVYNTGQIYINKEQVKKPTVFIPVLPGTNCEYDSAKAFEAAGANVLVKVFKNLTAEDIRESVETYEKAIRKSQIVMFPGGFSAGDEPEGSAKFFAAVFRNPRLSDAIHDLIKQRDGLMLGICNGFQALLKLGLISYGEICPQKEDSPTLTYNTIGRHISKIAYIKTASNLSPWLQMAGCGNVFCNPISHGEGRFVANDEWLKSLFKNGQVATQYCDINGGLSMDEYWNPNGSYMAIEGITSPDGRIYGKMAHSERIGRNVAINIHGEQDMKLFESGVSYFK